MKVLVTGVNGQLGYDVVKEIKKRGHEAIGVDREHMDLTIPSQIKNCILEVKPEAIIHCAAYTSVDAAEENEALCRQINAYATREIALYAKELDVPMIYISTDYVFDGMKGVEKNEYIDEIAYKSEEHIKLDKSKYIEYMEDDRVNPINIYGKTKLEGENYVKEILDKYYIVRISWVFGENGNNFIDTMLKLSKDRERLNVVDDQVGSPTYTKDLAPLLVDMIETDKYGTYHATNEGFCSWYDFAQEIFELCNIDVKVNPILTSQFPTKAKRPLNSKMSKAKLISNELKVLRSWKEGVRDYISNSYIVK